MTNLGETRAVPKNSVQVNNYNIYKSPESAQVEFHCNMRQGVRKRKPKGEEHFDILSASRADLGADVKRGHVMSHGSIGLLASMLFSIVCTVTVTWMREGSEKGCRRA